MSYLSHELSRARHDQHLRDSAARQRVAAVLGARRAARRAEQAQRRARQAASAAAFEAHRASQMAHLALSAR